MQGLPLIKPPYGRITAFNLRTGEIAWQVAHGDTPDNIRNHPALKGLDDSADRSDWPHRHARDEDAGHCRRTGVHDGRTILGAHCFAPTTKPPAPMPDPSFMTAPQTGSPMTYMLNGRQYIVVAIGGGGVPGELVAFRLP